MTWLVNQSLANQSAGSRYERSEVMIGYRPLLHRWCQEAAEAELKRGSDCRTHLEVVASGDEK
jgi:hypothetical protein